MQKIRRTLARDCTAAHDCPAVHEIDATTEQGDHLVQGYIITRAATLAALGARPGEVAVRLTQDVVEQMAARGIPMPWLLITPDGEPAAVGTTVPNTDDLLAGIGRSLPVGELLIVPRVLQEAVSC